MSRDNINFAYNLYNDNSDTNSISNHEISTDDLILFQTMVTNLLLERANFPLDEPKKYKHVISKTAKKQLKQIQYKTGLCNNICPIYKCEFIENEIITVLPCNHGFKTEAIDRWLNEEKAECPVCRLEFDSIEVKVKKNNPFESNTSDSLFDDTENDQISEPESDLENDQISEPESDLESDPISEPESDSENESENNSYVNYNQFGFLSNIWNLFTNQATETETEIETQQAIINSYGKT